MFSLFSSLFIPFWSTFASSVWFSCRFYSLSSIFLWAGWKKLLIFDWTESAALRFILRNFFYLKKCKKKYCTSSWRAVLCGKRKKNFKGKLTLSELYRSKIREQHGVQVVLSYPLVFFSYPFVPSGVVNLCNYLFSWLLGVLFCSFPFIVSVSIVQLGLCQLHSISACLGRIC